MKIRFVRPLPRIDHVIPAGFILDAPDGFAHKMIRTGRAVACLGADAVPTLEDMDRREAAGGAEAEKPDPYAQETEEAESVAEPGAEAAPPAAKKSARARKGN